jgi:hypothetical protein
MGFAGDGLNRLGGSSISTLGTSKRLDQEALASVAIPFLNARSFARKTLHGFSSQLLEFRKGLFTKTVVATAAALVVVVEGLSMALDDGTILERITVGGFAWASLLVAYGVMKLIFLPLKSMKPRTKPQSVATKIAALLLFAIVAVQGAMGNPNPAQIQMPSHTHNPLHMTLTVAVVAALLSIVAIVFNKYIFPQREHVPDFTGHKIAWESVRHQPITPHVSSKSSVPPLESVDEGAVLVDKPKESSAKPNTPIAVVDTGAMPAVFKFQETDTPLKKLARSNGNFEKVLDSYRVWPQPSGYWMKSLLEKEGAENERAAKSLKYLIQFAIDKAPRPQTPNDPSRAYTVASILATYAMGRTNRTVYYLPDDTAVLIRVPNEPMWVIDFANKNATDFRIQLGRMNGALTKDEKDRLAAMFGGSGPLALSLPPLPESIKDVKPVKIFAPVAETPEPAQVAHEAERPLLSAVIEHQQPIAIVPVAQQHLLPEVAASLAQTPRTEVQPTQAIAETPVAGEAPAIAEVPSAPAAAAAAVAARKPRVRSVEKVKPNPKVRLYVDKHEKELLGQLRGAVGHGEDTLTPEQYQLFIADREQFIKILRPRISHHSLPVVREFLDRPSARYVILLQSELTARLKDALNAKPLTEEQVGWLQSDPEQLSALLTPRLHPEEFGYRLKDRDVLAIRQAAQHAAAGYGSARIAAEKTGLDVKHVRRLWEVAFSKKSSFKLQTYAFHLKEFQSIVGDFLRTSVAQNLINAQRPSEKTVPLPRPLAQVSPVAIVSQLPAPTPSEAPAPPSRAPEQIQLPVPELGPLTPEPASISAMQPAMYAAAALVLVAVSMSLAYHFNILNCQHLANSFVEMVLNIIRPVAPFDPSIFGSHNPFVVAADEGLHVALKQTVDISYPVTFNPADFHGRLGDFVIYLRHVHPDLRSVLGGSHPINIWKPLGHGLPNPVQQLADIMRGQHGFSGAMNGVVPPGQYDIGDLFLRGAAAARESLSAASPHVAPAPEVSKLTTNGHLWQKLILLVMTGFSAVAMVVRGKPEWPDIRSLKDVRETLLKLENKFASKLNIAMAKAQLKRNTSAVADDARNSAQIQLDMIGEILFEAGNTEDIAEFSQNLSRIFRERGNLTGVRTLKSNSDIQAIFHFAGLSPDGEPIPVGLPVNTNVPAAAPSNVPANIREFAAYGVAKKLTQNLNGEPTTVVTIMQPGESTRSGFSFKKVLMAFDQLEASHSFDLKLMMVKTSSGHNGMNQIWLQYQLGKQFFWVRFDKADNLTWYGLVSDLSPSPNILIGTPSTLKELIRNMSGAVNFVDGQYGRPMGDRPPNKTLSAA